MNKYLIFSPVGRLVCAMVADENQIGLAEERPRTHGKFTSNMYNVQTGNRLATSHIACFPTLGTLSWVCLY